MRIVSLLPSATEILLSLTGRAGDPRVTLVGRSHECDFPAGAGLEAVPVLTAQRTRPGSAADVDADVRASLAAGEFLYTLDTDLLRTLRPDLIVTQDLCAVCSIDLPAVRAVAAALSPPPQILSLNPATVEAVFDDVLTVGRVAGLESRALEVAVALRERLYRAAEHVNPFTPGPAVAFLEWTDPLFIGGHWTPQLIERAGASHPLNPTVPVQTAGAAAGPVGQTLRAAGKSIAVPPAALVAVRPEALIVCPCGLSLASAWEQTADLAREPWWPELPAVRAGRVAVVDGNQMFNRPGPRLVDAFEFLVGWLNDRPDLIPPGFPWRPWPA